MTLEILQKEMITAMKAGNKLRKEVISSLISTVKKTAIDEKCKDNITKGRGRGRSLYDPCRD